MEKELWKESATPKDGQALKVFLVDIVPKTISVETLDDRIKELESLVDTYGGLVVLKTFQKRDIPDYTTYLGKWKLEEIMADMERLGATILIIWNVLKPSQVYQLNERLRKIGAQAWDRVDLILKIFAKHSVSVESSLQIELAAIKHMGPRIVGMGMELSRQGWGGSGAMRWLGETNTEVMRRHLKEKQFKIMKKLEEYQNMRKLHREWRKRKWMLTIGIVGYTNVGKSSLLNFLTGKWVLAENKLFATLWTHVGHMYLMTNLETGQGKEILLNDTIGFIRDLPPQLIKAFSSTLEDSIESDLLLHVADASDPFVEEKMAVVHHILDEIGAKQERILVFNKLDLVDKKKLAELKKKFPSKKNIRISVASWIGIEALKKVLMKAITVLW